MVDLVGDLCIPIALIIPPANGATSSPSGGVFISGGKLIFSTDGTAFETVTSS